ncbi:hypothetical protein [Clostridium paraputrificum]|uniref:hypothetical protein n=1 Tax=Clostridium paraputrificum TaxID=29363 RepID=UPI00232DBC4A|nr:hypothetical protein [Clostridium paraputrificum]MDB2107875.1 hypothetical protein [Clostridium paraputrificum]MDB2114827.1 hypothetical protein [Clostridium paraputrificum]
MNCLISNKLITLREQVSILKIKFKELKMMNYPDKDIEKVIHYMSDITDKIELRLNSFEEKGISSEKLSLISSIIVHFYERVGCVANCDIRNHPREIMIPIKELLSMTNENHLFITEPQWTINYSVGELLNKQFIEILNELEIDIEELNVIKLAFPKLHQDNVLEGAIMSHELGHYFDLHYSLDISEKIIVKLIEKIDRNKYVNNFYTHMQPSPYTQEELQVCVKAILPQIILRNWINECVADILGVLFYGVASYFSCENLGIYYTSINRSQTQFIESFSDTHPRSSFRNYVRVMTLSKMGHLKVYDELLLNKMDEYTSQWNEAETVAFRAQNIPINDALSFVVNSNYLYNIENDIKSNIDWIVDDIIKEIESVSEELIYKKDIFTAEVPLLVDKIKNIIPPNEVNGKPANVISILNAGWIAYTLYFDEIKNNICKDDYGNGECNIKEIIDNLLKKATLTANIHRRWINAVSK